MIQSTITNDCSWDPEAKDGGTDANEDLYQCMNFDLNANKPLTFEYILDNYNSQYGWTKKTSSNRYANDIVYMKSHIVSKWRVYMLSLGAIIMDGATVRAPRIGLCSNDIQINESKLAADFQGCLPD
jgi:hypothetical protein